MLRSGLVVTSGIVSDALRRADARHYLVLEKADLPKTATGRLAGSTMVVVCRDQAEVGAAISRFMALAVNVLVLGRFVVVKQPLPALVTLGVLPASAPVPVELTTGGGRHGWGPGTTPFRQFVREVQDATGAVVFVRHDFNLYGPYLRWVREGRKRTTIRYRKNGVEVPRDAVLPLYETKDYGTDRSVRPVETVRIGGLRYRRFGELTDEDGRRDGFASLDELRDDFSRIYPGLAEHDWVSIYDITLAGEPTSPSLAVGPMTDGHP